MIKINYRLAAGISEVIFMLLPDIIFIIIEQPGKESIVFGNIADTVVNNGSAFPCPLLDSVTAASENLADNFQISQMDGGDGITPG